MLISVTGNLTKFHVHKKKKQDFSQLLSKIRFLFPCSCTFITVHNGDELLKAKALV